MANLKKCKLKKGCETVILLYGHTCLYADVLGQEGQLPPFTIYTVAPPAKETRAHGSGQKWVVCLRT